MSELFDEIGVNYDNTRQADDYILRKILDYLGRNKSYKYLDLACGTGNYTIEMYERGYSVCGVDPSRVMRERAQEKCKENIWYKGYAESLPFGDDIFDGVFSVCALHHFQDIELGFREVRRVLNSRGKFVIFTCFQEQMKGYWLNHYFPVTMKKSIEGKPKISLTVSMLEKVGFKNIQQEKYYIREDLKDWFPYSKKNDPRFYLEESFRRGMSTFSSNVNEEEIEKGCKKLKNDISTKTIDIIINEYDKHSNEHGDYLFIECEK